MMNREDYVKQIPDYQYMRETVKKDENRLHFHLMPPTGWMNDPNGLCEFQGINHIYFQYTPFLVRLGNGNYGDIMTTTDWIHFHGVRAVPVSGFVTGTETVYTVGRHLWTETKSIIFTPEM